jgi:TolB protein
VALLLGCTSSEAPGGAAPPAIVFDWLRDGNRDIYRARLDGSDVVRLTADPGEDEHPTERAGIVVFTSYRDGNAELYSIAATGGAEQRLTTSAANETQPALSPDGRHIAYLSDESGVPKLWMCAADGTNPQPLTAGFGFAGSIEAAPSWAPSGDRLVFVSTARGDAGLFQLMIGSGSVTALVQDSTPNVEPAWSPDGQRIAFASERNGATHLYLLDLASGVVTSLEGGSGTHGEPAWLSDGRLVYVNWQNNVPTLFWLDPAAPEAAHAIDVGTGVPGHPTGVPD